MENKRKNEIIKNYINEKGWGSAHLKICKELKRIDKLHDSLSKKLSNNEINADNYFEISDELIEIFEDLEIIKNFLNTVKRCPENIRQNYFVNIDALNEKQATITLRALLK